MSYVHRPGRRQLNAEINVVPFIDVMLVLLVIFIITAPLLNQGIEVNLPKTQAKAVMKQEKEPLIVTVNAKGEYFLNLSDKPDKPVTARTLQHLVGDLLKPQQNVKPRVVLVKGDTKVDYGKVVEAMVLLQQSGAKSVGLITQPDEAATSIKS